MNYSDMVIITAMACWKLFKIWGWVLLVPIAIWVHDNYPKRRKKVRI